MCVCIVYTFIENSIFYWIHQKYIYLQFKFIRNISFQIKINNTFYPWEVSINIFIKKTKVFYEFLRLVFDASFFTKPVNSKFSESIVLKNEKNCFLVKNINIVYLWHFVYVNKVGRIVNTAENCFHLNIIWNKQIKEHIF